MKLIIHKYLTFIIHYYLNILLCLLLVLSLIACEKWDLSTVDFVEIVTGQEVETGRNSSERIIFGKIQGLVSNNSIDQHGHIWSSSTDTPTLENKDGQTTFLKRGNGDFQSTIKELSPSTVYYYRAYAIYENQQLFGNVRSFSTDSLFFNSVVNTVIDQTQFPEEIRAEVSVSISGVEPGIFINDYGLVWGRETKPTLEEDFYYSKGSIIADDITIDFSELVLFQDGINCVRPYVVIGGVTFYGDEKCFNTATWTQKADFFGTARSGAVGFSINNSGYIGTGSNGSERFSDFWKYDPQTDSWAQKADFGGGPRSDAVGFSIDGKGYIGMGISPLMTDFWEYDPKLDNWNRKADFEGERRLDATGFSIKKKGYVGIGYGVSSALYDFWEYDPKSDNWDQKADFGGESRSTAVGFSINGLGYVGLGYFVIGFIRPTDFWEYDPQMDSWTQRADFGDNGRFGAVGFSINGLGYVGLGAAESGAMSDLWVYSPQTDSWAQRANFGGESRVDAVGFSINDKGYIGTGSKGSERFSDFWEYDPGF